MFINRLKKNWPILIPLILGFLLRLPVGAQTDQIETLPTVGIIQILYRTANLIFTILLFLALIFLVYAGILYVTASGDPEKTEKAKRTIIYALVGIVVAVTAYGAVSLFKAYLAGGGTSGGVPGGAGAPTPPPPP